MFIVENWGWPQWVIVALVLYSLGMNAALSGKTYKRGSFGVTLLTKAIVVAVLICGGFYRTISWPQIIWTVLIVIALGCSYQLVGEKEKFSLFSSLIDNALSVFLFTMGGFFA